MVTTVQHTALGNAELHDLKGASTAAVNTVYENDGAGASRVVSPSKIGKVNAIGNSSTAATVNVSNGDVFTVTMTGNCTFTFSNAATAVSHFILIMTQDGTGSRTATWPASVKWANGSAPTLTTTASAKDIISFMSPDGGTTWYGFPCGFAFA